MDTRTGRIYSSRAAALAAGVLEQHLREMVVEPTPQQTARNPPKVGRNESCPCGSGKKFKRCCYMQSDSKPVGILP